MEWCFHRVLKRRRRTDVIRLNRHIVMECNFCTGYGVWSEGTRYEGMFADYFRNILKPGMTFVDVGTNVGYYTLLAAPILGGAGNIHCFEPVSEIYEMLRANLDRNRINMAVANRLIISDSGGPKTIHLAPNDNCGAASVSIIQRDDDRSETVEATTLDDYVRLRAVPRVDVVKIDAEGHEMAVLKGARTVLREKKPALLVEVRDRLLRQSGTSRAELYDFLKELGYAAYKIQAGARIEPISVPCDDALIVFRPKEI